MPIKGGLYFCIILDFKLFEPMISLQKEKEKDDKQLEEVSWHRFVVFVVVVYHSLVRGLIIFAEKLIFLPYLHFFCVFYPGSTQDLTTAN